MSKNQIDRSGEGEADAAAERVRGFEWKAIANGLAVGFIPLLFLQVGLGFLFGRLLPQGATAGSYPAAWLLLAVARLVPFALGGYAAARTAGERAPLRHAVLTAMVLALLGMLIGVLQPLGLPAVADLLTTTALALGAAWWGARAAAKRAQHEQEQD